MKMDLSKFKKTKEDEHSTVLQSPEGHSIQIAHKPLSPAFRAQLKKLPIKNMAEGGFVSNYPDGGYVSNQPDDAEDAPSEERDDSPPAAHAPVIVQVNPAPGSTPPPQANIDWNAVLRGRQGTPNEGSMSYPTPQAVAQAAGVNPTPPAGTPTPAVTQAAAAVPNAPQAAPATPGAPDPFTASMNAMQQAIGTGIQGEKELANARGQIGNQEAGIYGAQGKTLQDLQQTYHDNYQDLENERQAFIQDVQENKIDPQHYWTNHSKVATAIGLILGGIGGGVTGQENPAAKFLQAQMDMDLRAQAENLGANKSLLDANLRQFGNLNTAMTATRIMQNDMLVSKINEVASKNANPMAQAQAKIAIAPLLQQSAQLQQQLAVRTTLFGKGSAGMDPAQKLELMKLNGYADDAQYAAGNKEIASLSKVQAAHRAIDQISQKIADQQTLGNRVGNPLQSRQELAGLRAQLIPLIQSVSETKRLNPEVLGAEIDPFIQKFTTNKATAQDLNAGLHRLVQIHADDTPTLRGLGIQTPSYQPPAPRKIVKGVTYVRGPNGEAIPVKQ